MADDRDKPEKTLKRFGKSLKRALRSTSPKRVHQLRTGSRRLEAAVHALTLEDKPRCRRMLKSVARIRKKAGKVRDLDVLIRFTSQLAAPGHDESTSQLLDHIEAERRKSARKLHRSISRRFRDTRRRLKRSRSLFQSNGKAVDRQQSKIASAAAAISAELASWPRLTRANLHRYRLRLKELRYTLELIRDSDPGLIDSIGEVTDAIGTWHDWSELYATASALFEGRQALDLLRAIRSTVSAKLSDALVLASAMQSNMRPASAAPSTGQPHADAGPPQLRLQLPRVRHAEVKDAGSKRGIGAPAPEHLYEVPRRPRAA